MHFKATVFSQKSQTTDRRIEEMPEATEGGVSGVRSGRTEGTLCQVWMKWLKKKGKKKNNMMRAVWLVMSAGSWEEPHGGDGRGILTSKQSLNCLRPPVGLIHTCVYSHACTHTHTLYTHLLIRFTQTLPRLSELCMWVRQHLKLKSAGLQAF